MRVLRWIVGLFATFALLGLIGAVTVVWYYSRDLPDASQLATYEPPVVTRIYAGDGQLLRELALEGNRRTFVPVEQIPELVKNAFIAAEDQRFREHSGVDFMGVIRAIQQNLQNYGSGQRLIGASTITQQVAKNFLTGDEDSIERKIREALLAFRIEEYFSKDHILELYLNEIYFGRRSSGVAAAALNYFGKSLNELTAGEAAYLAGIIKGPENYRPDRYMDAALERRDYVLGRMLEDGYITGAEAQVAIDAPLVVVDRDPSADVPAGYFAEEVRRELVARFAAEGGAEYVNAAGLSVRTTLDPYYQELAHAALRTGLLEYDRRHGYRGPIAQLENFDNWPAQLAEIGTPDGAGDWRLAVVLEINDEVADLGFLNRERGLIGMPGVDWAAPTLENQRVGNAPSRVTQVLEKGDVILVSPRDPEAAAAYAEAFVDYRAALAEAGEDEEVPAPEPPAYKLEQIPNVGGGIVVMDPHTGRVLAMSGGYDYEMSEFNRATQAMRQPGSSFKPFVYLAALDDGFTPASIVLDAPFVLDLGPGAADYRPENYNGQFYGPLPLRVGLERSLNLMTVRLAYTVGLDRITDYARVFGIDENMEPFMSMALGAGETTVARLVGAYSQLVNGGRYVTPTLIDRIQDRYGHTLPGSRQDTRVCGACRADTYEGQEMPLLPDGRAQIADSRTTFQVVHMLQGVVQRGTASRLGQALPGVPMGGKTGTTDNGYDAWFVGFTPDLVVGAYVGFDQPRTLGPGEAGGRTALPVVREFLVAALDGQAHPDFRPPQGLNFVPVDRATGLRVDGGGDVVYEAFIPGTEPTDTHHAPRSAVVEVSASGPPSAEQIETGTGGLY